MAIGGLALRLELARWRRARRRASLWWRDDDARGLTPALERLLALADLRGTPLGLAVIPDPANATLAAPLVARPWVSVLQHGADHRNRRDGAHAGEFPPEAGLAEIAGGVAAGRAQLAVLEPSPVFAPPWNDVHPQLDAALRACAISTLSAYGEVRRAGEARLDAHVDLLRWRGGARFRGGGRFLADLAHELRQRRRAGLWDAPIGVLTHHLDHDPSAWRFLARFLAWSHRRPELAWRSITDLVRA